MKTQILFVISLIFLAGLVSADISSVGNPTGTAFSNPALSTSTFGTYNPNQQFANPSFTSYYSSAQINTYWPMYNANTNNSLCNQGSDFLITNF